MICLQVSLLICHDTIRCLALLTKNVVILGEWITPVIYEQCMPPTFNFVMEVVHDTKAVIFGGIDESLKLNNTVYIVDVHIINDTCLMVSSFIIYAIYSS